MSLHNLRQTIRQLSKDQLVSVQSIEQSLLAVLDESTPDILIAAFLTLYQPHCRSFTATHIAACVKLIKSLAAPIPLANTDKVIDIVGTGGDGIDTFNVSTAASLLVSCSSLSVLKLGNRAASSKCGSADLLEAVGANIQMNGEEAADTLSSVGFCFLFAGSVYPFFRRVAALRRSLGFRTLFNVLGPLLNPCNPSVQVCGVFSKSLGRLFAEVFVELGVEGAVFHGQEGLDEVSISGPSWAWFVKQGEIQESVVCPEDFGVQRCGLEHVKGGDAQYNSRILRDLFAGKEGPVLDFVVINAAAALYVAGLSETLKQAACTARGYIHSGLALTQLDRYIQHSQSFKPSILSQIYFKRQEDIAKCIQEVPIDQLYREIIKSCSKCKKVTALTSPFLMAEVKRASPSKGDFVSTLDVSLKALQYNAAGAAVISVLTEPHWFKGSIEDLRTVRSTIDCESRPLVLLKDFVFCEYQIVQARANGADLVLLIVRMIGDRVGALLKFAREIGMEALVEVASEDELEIARASGALFVGVNNRDLRSFEVDLGVTERVCSVMRDGEFIVAALSGVSSMKDIRVLTENGAGGVLVGESLMRSERPVEKARELMGRIAPVVKMCGFTCSKDMLLAAQLGVDLLGVIFCPSKRFVSIEKAVEMLSAVRKRCKISNDLEKSNHSDTEISPLQQIEKCKNSTPFFVGVFKDQSIEFVNSTIERVRLDFVQLHGNESPLFVQLVKVPVIKVIGVSEEDDCNSVLERAKMYPNCSILLDTGSDGGSGQRFPWEIAQRVCKEIPVIVAGGLDPWNVKELVSLRITGVDVCSGVEDSPGIKNALKMSNFQRNVLCELCNE